MHVITGRLNRDANTHAGEKGITFFVSLGEQNYNHGKGEKEWTNYDAALFASGKQVNYYTDMLREGAIISVSGSGLIIHIDEQYGPKLILQHAKLSYAHNEAKRQDTHNQGMAQANQAMDSFPDEPIPF